MSKETMQRILRAEEEARDIVLKAEQTAEEKFKDAEDEIFRERILFSEKLKAERNEKTRRAYMQTQVSGEEAAIKAEKVYQETKKGYEVFKEAAVCAVVDVILRGGDEEWR